jgi:hypothetical protein
MTKQKVENVNLPHEIGINTVDMNEPVESVAMREDEEGKKAFVSS